MKKTLMCFVILLLAVSARAQQSDRSTHTVAKDQCVDRGALEQVSERWKDGYNSGDTAKVAALYADNAYYLTQHFVSGIVHGRTAIQAYVQNGVNAHYQVDSIKIVALECAGDFAYTVTRYESTNANQKAFGVNLVVLRRVHGQWLIVAHEAAVPDPATAIQRLDVPAQTK
jgi:uncharacterized protein (TIGR02246 family)